MFRSLIMAAAAVATCTPLAFGAFEDGPVMPLPDAGERIVFDVYRNGDTRFGTHALSFTQDGQDLAENTSVST